MRSPLPVLSFTLAVFLCACDRTSPVSQAGQPTPPPVAAAQLTATERLAACAHLYATARTYRDQGEVRSVLPTHTTHLPFSTAFERDGRFLWEYRDTKDNFQYLVWSDDAKTFKSHWTVKAGTSTFDSADQALAGPTGISGTSAVVFNSLLMPNMQWGGGLLRVTDPMEVGTEVLKGVPCTKIQGKTHMGNTVVLWLASDNSIRQVAQTMTIPDRHGGSFEVETTISVTPTFNGILDAAAFERPASAK